MNMNKLDKQRPQGLMDNLCILWEQSGTKFYSIYKDKFVDVYCPACESQESDILFRKYGFYHRMCNMCKAIFVSPRPTGELLKKFYNDYEAPQYWNRILHETNAARKKEQYEPRVKKVLSIIEKNISDPSAIAVDLGAGSGAFALALKESDRFERVLALDLSLDCVKKCKSLGLEAELGSIELLQADSIDYMAMNDLIEHLSDPEDFLSSCNRLIKPGGLLSIACPNGRGFDFRIMMDKTANIHPPEHLQYFNPDSMSILLEKAGFKTIVLETPGVLDVQLVERAVRRGNFHIENNDFVKQLICESDDKTKESFQQFLSVNKLSSHMLVIAQKTGN